MRGAIPPLPITSSWRGAYLSTGTTLPFTFTFTNGNHGKNVWMVTKLQPEILSALIREIFVYQDSLF
jgi:hypothetical protein